MTFNAILFAILISAMVASFCLGYLVGQWKYRNYILKMITGAFPESEKKGDGSNGDH